MHCPSSRPSLSPVALATCLLALSCAASTAHAQSFLPGDLIVSGTTYQDVGAAASISVGQALPYGGKAVSTGSNLSVFNNESVDAAFGVTSSIFIQQLNGSTVDRTLTIDPTQMMSSFSSKSELGLNVSPDGKYLTLMGYAGTAKGGSALGSLDISNANTAAVLDPTNPVTATNARAIGTIELGTGNVNVTPVNAYSGNNGRAAVLANGNYYMVGNAGNSGKSPSSATLNALSANTGLQSIAQGSSGNTTVIGALTPNGQYGFDIAQVNGNAPDKVGKDDNFRGMTVFNNTLYVTKGSGGNGINTVYQVGATGALANGGTIPTNASITILPGFSTNLASGVNNNVSKQAAPVQHPFGIWFADPSTLFVADEGDASLADASKSMTDSTAPGGGLAEYKLVNGTWALAHTFQSGLNLGASYTVTAADGSSVTTATDGLRNITGKIGADGKITVYGVTSTVGSTLTDAGADPNSVVSITIDPANAAAATFTTIESATYGQVFRGVALSPVPEPASAALYLLGLVAVSSLIGQRTRQ